MGGTRCLRHPPGCRLTLIAKIISAAFACLFIFFPIAHAQAPIAVIPPGEQELVTHVEAIVDTIAEVEGRCGARGLSGEYGCYQYLPSTWRAYSLQVKGVVLLQTGENERMVTEGKVLQWKKEGRSDRWIFLQWNQGNGDGWGPGTKDCYSGTNNQGIHYDSCEYANRATDILTRIENDR